MAAMTDHLEPDRKTREELTRLFAGYLDDWLDDAGEMDASGEEIAPEALERLRRPPAETGRSPEGVLAVLEEAGRGGIYHPSGGHLSYIPNAGLYTSALGEFVAAGLNRYTGIAGAAPGFVAIEHGVVDWISSLFGIGPNASGILLSGGSMANLTALVTARITRLGDDFSRGCLYVSPHTHHSVAKAARIAGFRADQVVSVAVDDHLRMDPDALKRQVADDRADGKEPFLVAASAGTTDTGTVDDLNQIADVAAQSGLWLHVDGAYGGFFILTDRGRKVLDGIHRADSIALDPHKGLSIPFGVGALVVKEESHLVDAHLGRGAYLRDEDNYAGVRDIASLGPELSRPFRGLSVWLPLQLHGVAPFRDALDRSLDLAEHAYVRLAGLPGVEKIWVPDLSIVAFQFEDDDLGRRILEEINAEGRVHLSPTRVADRFVLRLAILNRRTTREHVDHAIDLIEKVVNGSG
jgi:aromatic-L-amino-acid/L-tryptophan decarboxylase